MQMNKNEAHMVGIILFVPNGCIHQGLPTRVELNLFVCARTMLSLHRAQNACEFYERNPVADRLMKMRDRPYSQLQRVECCTK